MTKLQISGVVITFNEEREIARCIETLLKVCDEIIVIDSFSTDQTQSICKSYGVRFFQENWKGYSKTKNLGIQHSKNDWILSLDADESLDDEAIKSIKAIKDNTTIDTVFSVKRKNFYENTWIKYCGWYPDTKIRLFHKDTATWKGDYVHETLTFDSSVRVSMLDGNILHHTIRDRSHHSETVHKYAKLAASKAKATGKHITFGKALLSSVSHFIKIFFFKKGLLHGNIGFKIASMSAYSKWLRYVYFRNS